MNICQKCKKAPARIHVTEVPETPEEPVQHHFCETCAVEFDLPFAPVADKLPDNIWKLLHLSKQATQRRKVQECPQCKMTLDELRRRGRMGCPHCYEAFSRYVSELIERMHGAREHVGQRPTRTIEAQPLPVPQEVPGQEAAMAATATQERESLQDRITGLQAELSEAIADEAYERAAALRDELRTLEATRAEDQPGEGPSTGPV